MHKGFLYVHNARAQYKLVDAPVLSQDAPPDVTFAPTVDRNQKVIRRSRDDGVRGGGPGGRASGVLPVRLDGLPPRPHPGKP